MLKYFPYLTPPSRDKDFCVLFSFYYHTTAGAGIKRSMHLKKEKKVQSFSSDQLFATPWTVAYQPPPSMGFSRQEYWSGLPFPSPGDLPDPGIEPRSPAFRADALPSEPPGNPSTLPRGACSLGSPHHPKHFGFKVTFRMCIQTPKNICALKRVQTHP